MKPILFNSLLEKAQKMSFFDKETISKIVDNLGLTFVYDSEFQGNVCYANSNELRSEFKEIVTPLDLLHYYYAILFSSKYNSIAIEFLKTNVPDSIFSIPKDVFLKLSQFGKELRKIHFSLNDFGSHYNIDYSPSGNDIISTFRFEKLLSNDTINENSGQIYINESQYFSNVSEQVWNFEIANQKPAQQWLNDRIGNKITNVEVLEYQKIIIVLMETIRIKREIDRIYI